LQRDGEFSRATDHKASVGSMMPATTVSGDARFKLATYCSFSIS
jgi:hypothetical protein